MSHTTHTPTAIQHYTPIAPLRLASGALLHGATVAYQTWGTLNAARDNVVWVCHALTASSDVESWWAGAFGPGRLLDPARHFIVARQGPANLTGPFVQSLGRVAEYAAGFESAPIALRLPSTEATSAGTIDV